MSFEQSHLPALDAAAAPAAVGILSAELQSEVDWLWVAVRREDKLSATTAQIARLEELLKDITFEPGATDWPSLRARMNAIGGGLVRTHPDDGPVQYVFGTWAGSIAYVRDTLDEVIAEVAEEEAKAAWALDSGKGHAAWKDGVAARKARKAARAAAKAGV